MKKHRNRNVILPVAGRSILAPTGDLPVYPIDIPGTGIGKIAIPIVAAKDLLTMKAPMRAFTATLIVLVAGVTLYVYQTSRERENGGAPAAGTSLGAALYADHCAACHGANLEGQPNWRSRLPNGRLPAPPHDETGHTWHHPDNLLFKITKLGTEAVTGPNYKSDMRGFGDTLNDRQIWAVLDFIKSRWPAEIRHRQATITARQRR